MNKRFKSIIKYLSTTLLALTLAFVFIPTRAHAADTYQLKVTVTKGSTGCSNVSFKWTDPSGANVSSSATTEMKNSSGNVVTNANQAHTWTSTINVTKTGKYTCTISFRDTAAGKDCTEVVEYTVDDLWKASFNMKGHGTQIADIYVNEAGKIVKPTDPSATGYTFNGWYKNSNLSTAVNWNEVLASNVTYYAKWTANTYQVKYNANKPSASTYNVEGTMSNSSHTYNTAKTLTANAFTLKGYTFKGWATSAARANAGTVDYTNKKSVNNLTATNGGTVNLYAVWELNSYSLTYNLASGALPSGKTNSSTYNVNTATFTLNNPQRTGYTFGGWTGTDLSSATTSVSVNKGSIGNRSYTATWSANPYRVRYNANKPSASTYDVEGSMSNSSHVYNTAKSLTTNAFTLKGYTFKGWATTTAKANAGTVDYTDKASVKNLTTTKNAVVDLYAVWSLNTYNLTYNLANGALPSGKTNPSTYNVNTANFTLNNPVRTGYTFEGWMGTDLTDKTITVTISKGTTGNRSFTANWSANPYQIRYNKNKPAASTYDVQGFMDNSDHIYDTAKNLSTNAYTLTGYTFKGWAKTAERANAGNVDFNNKASVSNLTATKNTIVDLYAVWSLNTYTLTYDHADGALPNSKTNPATYNVNTTTFTLNNPVRTGYNFAGWSGTELTGNNTTVTINKGSVGDRTYLAHWQTDSYYITFDANGGLSIPAKEYNIESETFTLPIPERRGYRFKGWVGTNVSTPTVTVMIPKGTINNKRYTAVWEAIPYTITYSLNGGRTVYYNKVTYTIETPTFTLYNPSRTGCIFLGWEGTEINGRSKAVTIVEGSTGDRTYSAIWNVGQANVTFNTLGGSTINSEKYDYGTPLTSIVAGKVSTKRGFSIEGWYKNSECTQKITESDTLQGDMTLFINWETARCIVSLDAGNGTISAVTVLYGSKLTDAVKDKLPVINNKDFKGWYKNVECTEPILDTDIVTGPVTVHARWIKTWSVHAPDELLIDSNFEEDDVEPFGQFEISLNTEDFDGYLLIDLESYTIIYEDKAMQVEIVPRNTMYLGGRGEYAYQDTIIFDVYRRRYNGDRELGNTSKQLKFYIDDRS